MSAAARTSLDYTIVDTVDGVQSLIKTIHSKSCAVIEASRVPFAGIPSESTARQMLFDPQLYIDLEGQNLCRSGTISIMQIYVAAVSHTYLVDVFTLGATAFDEQYGGLKAVLEDSTIVKVLYDCRNDNDALYNLYGIDLQGVVDLQLMEYATRPIKTPGRSFFSGLGKALDQVLVGDEKIICAQIKEAGVQLFAPERGGSYAVFDARPMSEAIVQYCVQDVAMMPRLYDKFSRHVSAAWRQMVAVETVSRLACSRDPTYTGQGREKARPPLGW